VRIRRFIHLVGDKIAAAQGKNGEYESHNNGYAHWAYTLSSLGHLVSS
jgi:hypothetical protein